MDDIIYTDGQGIKVTSSEFYAGNTSYSIDGIVNAQMLLIQSAITPVIVLILIGFTFIITGYMHVYSDVRMDNFYLTNILITANRLAIIAGCILLLIGIIMSMMVRDRYAVQIITAEGEKMPVISKRRDYVYQIVLALQKAMNLK